MPEPQWNELLNHPAAFNKRRVAEPEFDGWLGYPAATNEQILLAEQRLQLTLPEDLKSFYRVSNGWRVFGEFGCEVAPVERLQWLSIADADLYSNCMVDADPPSDELEREWWYEQGIKVCRSILLSSPGSEVRLLYDPSTQTLTEPRYGTWAAWNPAMAWSSQNFVEFFVNGALG